jgi:hypothetical protein
MGDAETPYEAITVTYMCAVLITLIYIASSVAGKFYSLTLYTLSTFYLYSLWIGLMIAYLLFRKRYSALKRNFRSPLGVYGAYVAIFSAVQHFLTQFYPIHGYSFAPFIVFVLSMVGLTYIYARWIIKFQKYSEEEERVFFVTYIVSANRRSQHRRSRKRGTKHTHGNGNHPYSGNSSGAANAGACTSSGQRTLMLFGGEKSLYEFFSEILSPSNVAHRDLQSGIEDSELDQNELDRQHPQFTSHFLKTTSALSRVIPTIQVDHSLDLHLDGSLAAPSRNFHGVDSTGNGDFVEDFVSIDQGNSHMNSTRNASYQHRKNIDIDDDDHMEELFPMPSSTTIVDRIHSQSSQTGKNDKYDRLALSDIPEDEP